MNAALSDHSKCVSELKTALRANRIFHLKIILWGSTIAFIVGMGLFLILYSAGMKGVSGVFASAAILLPCAIWSAATKMRKNVAAEILRTVGAPLVDKWRTVMKGIQETRNDSASLARARYAELNAARSDLEGLLDPIVNELTDEFFRDSSKA